MEIIIVNQYALTPDQPGGGRHYYMGQEFVAAGHSVTVVASNFNHQSRKLGRGESQRNVSVEVVDGIRYVWIPSGTYSEGGIKRVLSMLKFSRRARRWIVRENQNNKGRVMIVGSSPSPFGAYAAARAAKSIRGRFVLEIRDIWPESLVELGVSKWNPLVLVLKALERFLYRQAEIIFFLMPGFPEYLKAKYGSAHLDKICYAPNCVTAVLSEPDAVPARSEIVVAYAGSFGEANAIGSLVQAARNIVKINENVSFVFYGEGPKRDKLVRTVQEETAGRIRFPGSIPKQDIVLSLRQADILFASTRDLQLYRWGISPNKIFDYLLAGRPVVFGVNSYNDPVSESGAGLTARPEDSEGIAAAVQQMLEMSPQERYQIGVRGYNYVLQKHNWSAVACKMLEKLNALA